MGKVTGKRLRAAVFLVALCWGMSSWAQQLPIVKYDIDKVTAKWNDMEARLTIDADYPEGNTPAARTLQRWLYELFTSRNFHGQILTGKQLMARVEADFIEANTIEEMKKFAEDGAEEGNWFFNYRVKKEYESSRIASFTYSWDAYQVGNATSNANIIDISVCKTDGRILGWEMFTSVQQLKKLLDKQLVEKFGEEGADLYLKGTPPMPRAPLFLKDGVRFDFGDYTIYIPHVYEETGEYPFAFLEYADIKHLLTDEAKALLGLSGQAIYDAIRLPDYEQVSYRLKATKTDASHVRCDFLKRTIAQGKTRVYPSYLIYVTEDNGTSWKIERESDQVTDKNLERLRK